MYYFNNYSDLEERRRSSSGGVFLHAMDATDRPFSKTILRPAHLLSPQSCLMRKTDNFITFHPRENQVVATVRTMGSLFNLAVAYLLLFVASGRAQQKDGVDVPENFPKAFITAIAVGIVCTVILVTLVCVCAHCWQYIIVPRGRRTTTGSSLVPERWLTPVFEWPQQLIPRRSRNNMKNSIQRQGQQQRQQQGQQQGQQRSLSVLYSVVGTAQGEKRGQNQDGTGRGWWQE
ncbi:hypothetical protein F4819DRAFT_75716 [Hypoxylon fuscum]|nr:hypothetical protein F4819DRAFT_75716 [Hypoxylon fuscum]